MALTDGSPAAMHAEASFWRAQARIVMDVAQQAQGKATAVTFQGPAAERFRAAVRANSSQAYAAASDLMSLAASLDADADTVQAAQAAQARAQAEAEAQARAAAAAAAVPPPVDSAPPEGA